MATCLLLYFCLASAFSYILKLLSQTFSVRAVILRKSSGQTACLLFLSLLSAACRLHSAVCQLSVFHLLSSETDTSFFLSSAYLLPFSHSVFFCQLSDCITLSSFCLLSAVLLSNFSSASGLSVTFCLLPMLVSLCLCHILLLPAPAHLILFAAFFFMSSVSCL
jgi:hypothetical protein